MFALFQNLHGPIGREQTCQTKYQHHHGYGSVMKPSWSRTKNGWSTAALEGRLCGIVEEESGARTRRIPTTGHGVGVSRSIMTERYHQLGFGSLCKMCGLLDRTSSHVSTTTRRRRKGLVERKCVLLSSSKTDKTKGRRHKSSAPFLSFVVFVVVVVQAGVASPCAQFKVGPRSAFGASPPRHQICSRSETSVSVPQISTPNKFYFISPPLNLNPNPT